MAADYEHVVSLKPNRDLLNPQFNGYKISLEKAPLYSFHLAKGVKDETLSSNQFSFLHAKVFGATNLLHHDPWHPKIVYFIDGDDNVNKVLLKNDDKSADIVSVFSLNLPAEAGVGDSAVTSDERCNHSMCFVSHTHVLVCSGSQMSVVRTGNRSGSGKWQLESCIPCVYRGTVARVVDGVQSEGEVGDVISCCLLHILEMSEEEKAQLGSSNHFYCILRWITLSWDVTLWSVRSERYLCGLNAADYVGIHKEGTNLCVASESPFRAGEVLKASVSDERNVEKDVDDGEQKIENGVSEATPQDDRLDISSTVSPSLDWSDEGEEINISVELPSHIKKSNIRFILTCQRLEVSTDENESILSGNLLQPVQPDLSTYVVDERKKSLEISLWKEVEDIHWTSVFEASEQVKTDQEDILRSLVDDKPAYNSQQLEECDAFPEDTAVFQIFDGACSTQSVAHIDSNKWLFNVQTSVDKLPHICLRHDVDGLMWAIEPAMEMPFTHVDTLDAFGYVQASKQHRKFTTCATDLSYACICASHLHLP